MLYTTQDYIEIKIARRNFWLQVLAVTSVFIIAIVIASITRIDLIGYAVAVIWAIVVVSLWGMRGSRILKYYHFLKDISEGLENTIIGTVEYVDSSINIKEMLDFYLVVFREDKSDPDSPARKLYIDASKGLPIYENGTRLKLNLFGNFIKGIEAL